MILELVFLVDLAVALEPARHRLLAAERSVDRDRGRVRVALAGARGDLFARDGGGLADGAARGRGASGRRGCDPRDGVGARRQHGVELLAGGRLHVAQKALLFRHAAPAVLDRDATPSASVKAAMSSALPKACSEICACGLPFMPRQE
jgi:hypothetical protein